MEKKASDEAAREVELVRLRALESALREEFEHKQALDKALREEVERKQEEMRILRLETAEFKRRALERKSEWGQRQGGEGG
jgi:hypothetical protein